MTRTDDLSRLKQMAEEMKLPGILSLIARVEKAEELVIDRGVQITELAERLGAAEARVRELEGALKPFADQWHEQFAEYFAQYPDDSPDYLGETYHLKLTSEHLRAAARALGTEGMG